MRAIHLVGSQWLRFRRKKTNPKPLISTVLKGSRLRMLFLTFSKGLWASLNSNGFKHMLKYFPEGGPMYLGKCYITASFTFIINPSTRSKLFFHLLADIWVYRIFHLRLACFLSLSCCNLISLGLTFSGAPHGQGALPAWIRLHDQSPHLAFHLPVLCLPGVIHSEKLKGATTFCCAR